MQMRLQYHYKLGWTDTDRKNRRVPTYHWVVYQGLRLQEKYGGDSEKVILLALGPAKTGENLSVPRRQAADKAGSCPHDLQQGRIVPSPRSL
jgi:hypothetical protein